MQYTRTTPKPSPSPPLRAAADTEQTAELFFTVYKGDKLIGLSLFLLEDWITSRLTGKATGLEK